MSLRTVQLHHRRFGGFTLVELLVVIAIIGVLVGLLLPAVQAAREAARRCSCQNNMAQLGIATHNYEFSMERLPSGCINPDGPIRNEAVGQHVGYLVQLLPYVEQSAIASNFDVSKGTYADENADARASKVQTFLCPSFPMDSTNGNESGLTNYAGCHHHVESPVAEDNKGLLFLNSRVRYSDITDGASHTILIGEMLPDPAGLGWASGTRASLRNAGSLNQGTEYWQRQRVADERDVLEVGGFQSVHQGGAQFCFADGSIRFLSNSIDEELLQNLGNREDGSMMGLAY